MKNAFLYRIDLFKKQSFSLLFNLILVATFISFPLVEGAFGAVSSNVPLDDYAYNDLEKLVNQGLIKSDLWGTRPISRIEMARLIHEAREGWDMLLQEEQQNLEIIRKILVRFENEFWEELSVVSGFQESLNTFVKPIERVTMGYRFQDDDYSLFNNEGLDYYEGNNALVETTMRASFKGFLGVFVQPRFVYYENKDNLQDIKGNEVKDSHFTFHTYYSKLQLGKTEILYGRDTLWWNPCYHGALIMSNNAEPFRMYKLSNPNPTILPWFFKHLGLFKYSLVFATLDSQRLNPRPGNENFITNHNNPYFSALHLDMKPFPWLELGVNHINIYGGEGRTDLDYQDHLELMFRNKNLTGDQSANSETSAFMLLRWYHFSDFIPLAETLSLYGEWGGEDKAYPPDDRAFQVGLLFGDFLKWRSRLQLRLEYINTTPFKDEPKDVWYSHPEYPATYEGRVFGHHVGSNAEDYFARLDISMTPRVDLGLQADYERRGTALEAEEKVLQWQLDTHYRLSDHLSLLGMVGIEEMENAGFIKGETENHSFFSVWMRYYF